VIQASERMEREYYNNNIKIIVPDRITYGRVMAIRSRDYNMYNYCSYKEGEILYMLGYNMYVYFTSTSKSSQFSKNDCKNCGFLYNRLTLCIYIDFFVESI
jgi:hypothetical protein